MPRGRARVKGGASKGQGDMEEMEAVLQEAEENLAAGGEKMHEEAMEVGGRQDMAASSAPLTFNIEGADCGETEISEVPQKVASFDISEPRLMITHIVNENFMSYAGVQTLGPFQKNFSIVGPNDNSKSSVIDSMLFVFGYRANMIRSKVSMLIHNSENHKDITSCTVIVHFQKIVDTWPGEDEYTVVPDSKLVVSRTAFKDNTSWYSVNGKQANYKEVAALFWASGIDLDYNRFLILQGEMEHITMMKPKEQSEQEDGMLEFLEDIIGSNRFKQLDEIRCNSLSPKKGGKNVASKAAKVTPKLIACIAAGSIATIAAPVVVPAVASAIGFTSAGVAAGSAAATMMSVTWKAGHGMWLVSSLQSIGAAGLGAKGMAACGAIASFVTSRLFKKK